jgi:hypothetical protein
VKVVIVIAVVLVLAVAGFFVGGMSVDSSGVTSRSGPILRADGSRDYDREMMESQRGLGQATEVLRQRQQRSMIGAGVGLAVGLAAGLLLASRMGSRKA